ncbi:MAG TPA: diiron oxygenase [Acidimicrobiales bacterium]|nr:diiron oxygenase [Acidimicrobiales bacterium]
MKTGGGTATSERDEVFGATVRRLSRQSVDKHFDAYADVDWDAPEMAIYPEDPRFKLWSTDPLASTEWYRSQPPEIRSRVALHRIAAAMRIGWEFENVLQRGLLEYAFWMGNHREEFRYVHHEITEESQHTMMFQEVIDRSGLDVKGMPRRMKVGSRPVVWLSRLFPPLFFLFVLGGEDPVDHLQRGQLRNGESHPAIERIIRIHVTEEARHISFARQYLKRAVPRLGIVRRRALGFCAPFLFGTMSRLMCFPPPSLLRTYGVPRSQARKALRSPEARQLLRDSVAKPRKLCAELGLVNPVERAAWKLMGVWDDDSKSPAHGSPALGSPALGSPALGSPALD